MSVVQDNYKRKILCNMIVRNDTRKGDLIELNEFANIMCD